MARKSRKNRPIQQPVETIKYKVGIYARISYAENDNSVQMQIDSLKEVISKNWDMQLVEIYSDVNISSFDSVRPSFEKLLEDVRSRKINCIIVRDFSRFGRDYIETGNYIERIFPLLDVRFISQIDGYDSANINDNDYFNNSLKQIFNYCYSADLSRKVKNSLKIRMACGAYVAPKIPYGFEKVRISGETIYKPVQSKADIIKEIFRLASSGNSIYSITKILNQQNADNRVWTQNFVKRILCNKFYTGNYQVGKSQSDFRRKTVTKITSEQWIDIDNHHDEIVDYTTFYQVEKILNRQSIERNSSDKTQDLCKGILYCGDCKRKLLFILGE